MDIPRLAMHIHGYPSTHPPRPGAPGVGAPPPPGHGLTWRRRQALAFDQGLALGQYSWGTGLRSRAKIGSPSVVVKKHQKTDA